MLNLMRQWHHLVDLYQICSNYAPVAKSGPAPGVTRDKASFLLALNKTQVNDLGPLGPKGHTILL